ncbi:MAG: DUF4270 family protein [Bacteroidota bacterium]
MIRNLLAGVCISLCVFLLACEEPDLVSSDVIPGTDQPGVFVTDTSSIIAFSMNDDSLVSSNNGSPICLGSLNDQVLGSTEASFYIQMLINNSAPTVLSTAVADSMVISFAYHDIYGDKTSLHSISVYEMATTLVAGTIYHSTDSFELANASVPLGTVTTQPNQTDSVTVNGVVQVPQLRIPMSNTFTQKIMNDIKSTPAFFVDNPAFLNYFKGLYIKSTAANTGSGDVKGSIIAFDATSSINTVTLFYRDHPDSTVLKSYSFNLGSSSLRSVHVVNSYNPGITNDSLQTPASLYIQSLGGLKVKVKFPYISNFIKEENVSINKAELIVKVKSGTTDVIKPHVLLWVTEDNGTFISDYDATTLRTNGLLPTDGDTYTFNVSRQMQRILNGTVNNNIYLTASDLVGDRSYNAQRTILEGAGSIKLKLTYTIKNN